ncbi:response regulator [Reichenbachiella sp. MALMAid0571]|uniref:response regulator n=1 Tax=Reichenbachiella sp. MALMAid0571 TaxID=3143939 RepID=UPI0032DF185C
MKKKLNSILLIDDDKATNFLHEMVLNDMDCTEEIVAMESAIDALEYLKSTVDGKHPQPDLIFLDINMPAMNGWEFLVEYEKLDELKKGRLVLMMLTTSLNPDDEEAANLLPLVAGFLSKPLTIEMVEEVLKENFADLL